MRRSISPSLLAVLLLGLLIACGDEPATPDAADSPRERPSPERPVAGEAEDRVATFRLPALPLPTLESVVPDPPPPQPVAAPTAEDPLRGASYTIEPAASRPDPDQPVTDGPALQAPPAGTAAAPAPPQDADTPTAQAGPDPEGAEDGPQLLSLADFEGQPLVIHFFASWCEPCLAQMRAWERAVAAAGSDDGEDESDEEEEAGGAEPGGIRRVAILVEQHPERARLFLQWQRIDLPVMVDSLDLYRLSDLPVTVLVDRSGNARFAPPPEQAEEGVRWMLADRPARGPALPPLYDEVPDLDALFESTRVEPGEESRASDEALETYAQALFLWGGPALLTTAIESYESLMERDPDVDGWLHFRLGTLYRARYDSEHRRPGDFAAAVRSWQEALERAPHSQIFRRRLQQYGPRMTKPFTFYDWLPTARQAVRARGEVPIPTPVPLARSETVGYAPPPEIDDPFADPLARPEENPRLRSRRPQPDRPEPPAIPTDPGEMVEIEAVTVPRTARPGEAARVYFVLRPKDGVAWQPGSEILVRLRTPTPWRAGAALIGTPATPGTQAPTLRTGPPGQPTQPAGQPAGELVVTPPPSGEDATRRVEVDVRIPANARRGRARLPADVLYTVCRGAGGCTLLRQDLPLVIGVDSGAPSLADEILPPLAPAAAG